MGAFLCSDKHISYLVSCGYLWRVPGIQPDPKRPQWTDETPEDYTFRRLVDENLASVAHRYRGRDKQEREAVKSYRYQLRLGSYEPVAVLKALCCYEYQTCEHPSYEDNSNPVPRWVDRMRSEAIARLPGYNEAVWEVTT